MAGRERVLIAAFVRLADSLVADYDPVELAQEIVDVLGELLPGTSCAVLLADHLDRLQVLSSASESTRLLELFQIQADSGPCLTAYKEGRAVRIEDLTAERARWPVFTDHVRAEGWAAMYALPMRLRDDRIGVINLFAPRPRYLGDDDVALAQAIADVATIGILHARALADSLEVSAQLQGALNSRLVIEQADINMDAAFAALRNHARATNTRLIDLARTVIDHTADTAAILARRHPAP
ncbi:GAF and ANTAR domain-containing protein [Nocardia blacklockiae]|uniref:GAF and ANTAR domain-containing protein n=1 Tax=Nocardia blacklockiae TaxID=480036 RepID=UPI0018947420|nr:GAF and ANTAR domain-containing protein [Nocardia blacklockiae]MBF6173749.1 GAF and ANTAR domain-containing protein [Nocardia blacklockiae]